MKILGFSILFYTAMLLLMSNLFIGCDDPMMDPLMDTVFQEPTDVVQQPTDVVQLQEDQPVQEELPTIKFAVDIVERALPEGFQQLRSDEVYYDDEFFGDYLVADTAKEAIENEKTVRFFNDSAKWLSEICGKVEYESSSIELNIYFTDRQERERFTSAVPNYEVWNVVQSISIVNGTAYYFQHIRPIRALCDVE